MKHFRRGVTSDTSLIRSAAVSSSLLTSVCACSSSLSVAALPQQHALKFPSSMPVVPFANDVVLPKRTMEDHFRFRKVVLTGCPPLQPPTSTTNNSPSDANNHNNNGVNISINIHNK
ncbi:Hypothetical protein, putative [Bodo saltans]|uniref:Uncharacterized protein n=1 Tax=Bodo saltans TaxID=75058 RepID=A0A0S4IP31_BODSA|nr:Hypothetical protein, putative [Bodo saltans]|eukprot:CUF77711.1 Hypothetical protein, putative [Bodo saltans]